MTDYPDAPEEGENASPEVWEFRFRLESGLIEYDSDNDLVWPGEILHRWIMANDVKWQRSSGGTFVIVTILEEKLAERFRSAFFLDETDQEV